MSKNPDYFIREKQAHTSSVPVARKSLGEFKPVLKYGKRTEVLAQAASKNIDGYRTFARGLVFKTSEEALIFADIVKQHRIDECVIRAKKQGFDI